MNIKNLGFVAVILLCKSAFAQQADTYVTIGTAYSIDGKEELYREAYTALDEQGVVRVDYLSTTGQVFATKSLNFRGEPFQPGFELQDFRDNELISAIFSNARLEVIHKDKSGLRKNTLMNNASIVIDAGMDAYVQLNWDKLMQGKTVFFSYLMVDRLSSVDMQLEKIDSKPAIIYDASYGSSWVYFKVMPAARWKTFFSDPIYLAYDPNGKYLMRFVGRSLIDDAKGMAMDVKVHYEYF